MTDVLFFRASSPTGSRLVEALIPPGGRSFAVAPDRQEGTGWWRVARAESGAYVVRRPRDGDDKPRGRLACPQHGTLLADVHLAAGETVVFRAWCPGCRARHTIARVVMAEGEILLVPDVNIGGGQASLNDLVDAANAVLGSG